MWLYKKIINKICGAFEYIAMICLVAMVVVVMTQVVGRYVFSNTPSWTEELARQFVVIFSFVGIAIGVRDKIHIALTIFADAFLKKLELPLEILVKFVVLVLGIMLSINMGLLFSMLRYNKLPGTGIPVLCIYAFPTLIGILVSCIAFYQIYDHVKHGTDEQQRAKLEQERGNK